MRLAAAGRAEQGDELALPHLERDVVDGEHLAVRPAEALVEVRDRDADARGASAGTSVAPALAGSAARRGLGHASVLS